VTNPIAWHTIKAAPSCRLADGSPDHIDNVVDMVDDEQFGVTAD
jgi:hypothetical protein